MGPGNFRTSSHLFPIYDAQLNPSGFCVAAAPGVLYNILISKSAQNKDIYCHSSQHYSACRVPGCFDTVHCFSLSSAQATFQVQLTFFDALSQLLFSFWSGLHDVYQRSDCPESEWRQSLLLNTISQWLPKQLCSLIMKVNKNQLDINVEMGGLQKDLLISSSPQAVQGNGTSCCTNSGQNAALCTCTWADSQCWTKERSAKYMHRQFWKFEIASVRSNGQMNCSGSSEAKQAGVCAHIYFCLRRFWRSCFNTQCNFPFRALIGTPDKYLNCNIFCS